MSCCFYFDLLPIFFNFSEGIVQIFVISVALQMSPVGNNTKIYLMNLGSQLCGKVCNTKQDTIAHSVLCEKKEHYYEEQAYASLCKPMQATIDTQQEGFKKVQE